MKKVIGIIVAIIAIISVAASLYFFLGNNSKNESNPNTENNNKLSTANSKILVIYFSATNNTKNVAEKIADNLEADIFEIIPEDKYTSKDLEYGNKSSRVSKEHDDESLRDIKLEKTKVDNWDAYDTVLIGYPIWWGVAAWPMSTFVKANDFNGKTVIPFCTSASSGMGESGNLLAKEAGAGSWQNGHRFSSNASDADIKNWTDTTK